jgi:hypothetical protein
MVVCAGLGKDGGEVVRVWWADFRAKLDILFLSPIGLLGCV